MRRSQAVLSVVICLLPILLGVILWDKLPGQVAVHFDVSGNPDNYAPKALVVFGLPVFIAAIDAAVIFFLMKDPKAKGHSKIMRQLNCWICPVISSVAIPVTLFIAIGKDIPISMIIGSLVGLTIVVVGNYLPKCKQNYTMGIKLPWTLDDEDNWNYTHRKSGFVWVLGGFAMTGNAFLQIPYVNIVVIILLVSVPFVISFGYYKKHIEKKNVRSER